MRKNMLKVYLSISILLTIEKLLCFSYLSANINFNSVKTKYSKAWIKQFNLEISIYTLSGFFGNSHTRWLVFSASFNPLMHVVVNWCNSNLLPKFFLPGFLGAEIEKSIYLPKIQVFLQYFFFLEWFQMFINTFL